MEVPHKHRSEHKKNWKEYISEFFMLFLAVFAGFIAENIREHYLEKGREKEYMISMVSDLERDTSQLRKVKDINKRVLKGIDTLLAYLKSDINDSTAKKIYVFAGFTTTSMLHEPATGTFSQLKNAGGYRLIKDTAALPKISDYDEMNALLLKQGDAYYKGTLGLIESFGEVLDFSVAKPQIMGKAKPNPHPYFVKNDPDKLRMLYNKCYMQQNIITAYTIFLSIQRKKAEELISLLKTNYHLEYLNADSTKQVIGPSKKDTAHVKK